MKPVFEKFEDFISSLETSSVIKEADETTDENILKVSFKVYDQKLKKSIDLELSHSKGSDIITLSSIKTEGSKKIPTVLAQFGIKNGKIDGIKTNDMKKLGGTTYIDEQPTSFYMSLEKIAKDSKLTYDYEKLRDVADYFSGRFEKAKTQLDVSSSSNYLKPGKYDVILNYNHLFKPENITIEGGIKILPNGELVIEAGKKYKLLDPNSEEFKNNKKEFKTELLNYVKNQKFLDLLKGATSPKAGE
jgi:hypothetical protein